MKFNGIDAHELDTLSAAMDALTQEGFTEDFKAIDQSFTGLYSKKKYPPSSLIVVYTFRFDGMTDPADETELFAIVADDGTKGTLVMSYGPAESQNTELIKQLREFKQE